MADLEFLVESKNGLKVYFDPVNSHTATHFTDTPQLKELVEEILIKLELAGNSMKFDTDMGRIVGKSDLVKNDPGDEIVFAKRKNRDIYTSFNKTKKPQPSSLVAISLEKIDDKGYELVSVWIGTVNLPSFPGDLNETLESKQYWLEHSLAWGTQDIQSETLTTTCPW